MIRLSVLDLSPILQGHGIGQSLRNSADLARHAERLGYERFWLAEHHNLPGVASAATAVVIGHVGAATSTIRIGAGGIMLPNHAPLVIAEQFGTLAELYPGRVDLAVGRAPGTDQLTARALRRTLVGDIDRFPHDVIELMAYFKPAEPGQVIQAVPGAGTMVPVWILGSSTYGAQLAAALGLPYGFASHFAPADMEAAIALYRRGFQPSEYLAEPYLMLGLSVIAGESDEEAAFLATSAEQMHVARRLGQHGPLKPPVAGYRSTLGPESLEALERMKATAVIGGPDTIRRKIEAFQARTGADELIIATQIYDHEARKRSYAIAARARDELNAPAPAPVG